MTAPTFRSVAAQTDGSFSTSVTITKPTGVVSGDLLFAALAHWTPNSTMSSVPSGWNLIAITSDSDSYTLATYYKIAGGSEPANYTWTWNGATFPRSGAIACYQAPNASPFDAVAPVTWVSGSSTSIATPSVTSSAADELIISALVVNPSATSGMAGSPPSGMTERADYLAGSAAIWTGIADVAQASAGASGTKTWTLTKTSNQQAGQTIAFKGASTVVTSDVTSSAAINSVIQSDVTSSASIARTPSSDVTSSASLTAPITSEVSSDAAIEMTIASDVTSGASVSITGITSSVTSTAALARTESSDVTSQASCQVSGTFVDVFTDASLGQTARETVITDASLGVVATGDVSSTAAIGAGEYTPNHSQGALRQGTGRFVPPVHSGIGRIDSVKHGFAR